MTPVEGILPSSLWPTLNPVGVRTFVGAAVLGGGVGWLLSGTRNRVLGVTACVALTTMLTAVVHACALSGLGSGSGGSFAPRVVGLLGAVLAYWVFFFSTFAGGLALGQASRCALRLKHLGLSGGSLIAGAYCFWVGPWASGVVLD